MSQPGDSRDVTASPPPWGKPSSWDGAPPPVPGQQPPPVLPAQLPPEPPLGWPAPARPGAGVRPTAGAMLAVAAAVTVLGAPFGLVWSMIAPDVPLRMTAGGPVYADAQPEQLVAADGWFAILALPFGVLVAVGGWLLARRVRGVPALVALVVGAVGAGLLGWWLGRQIGLSDYRETLAAAEVGTLLERPPDLAVVELGWWPPYLLGVLLLPALAAAITYTLLAAWSRFPTLHPH